MCFCFFISKLSDCTSLSLSLTLSRRGNLETRGVGEAVRPLKTRDWLDLGSRDSFSLGFSQSLLGWAAALADAVHVFSLLDVF